MKTIRSLLLLSTLALAACQQAPEADNGPTAGSAPNAASTAEAPAAAASQTPAADSAASGEAGSTGSGQTAGQGGSSDSATAQAEAADGAPAQTEEADSGSTQAGAGSGQTSRTETSAAKTSDASGTDPAVVADIVQGTDYEVIQGGHPFEPLEGKIEVVEVFNYICPACWSFEPQFTAWKAKVPSDVRVTYVPAPFNPQWVPYVRAYYVAHSMGLVEKTHTAMFHAIHVDHSLPGEGQKPNEEAIAEFYGKYGADPKHFLAAMNSFSTMVNINRSNQFIAREGVDSTPTIVVDGKYRVTTRKSYADVLRVTDALIAMERAEMKRTPK